MIEENCVKLVLAVARLGEADLFGWWESWGFTDAGEYVLAGAFPRTCKWSALEGAVLSAASRHQEVLPRPTAIHLFSDQLPVKGWALAWLREQKMNRRGNGLLERMRAWDRRSGCEELAKWAGIEPPAGEVVAHGRRLGTVSRKQLSEAEQVEYLVRQLAAAYAHRPEDLRFPYFDLI